LFKIGQYIRLGNPTPTTTARNLAWVKPLLIDQSPHGGAETIEQITGDTGFCCASRCVRCRSSGWFGGAITGLDIGNQITGLYRTAVALQNLAKYSVSGGGDFQNDFIGFQIDQIFITLDLITGLFVPAHQRSVCDGFWKRRNTHFNTH
jgi:hypothetical protein